MSGSGINKQGAVRAPAARLLLEALARGVSVLDALLAPGQQDAEASRQGCHPYLQYRGVEFLEKVALARALVAARGTTGATSFLDVGSGTGVKSLLASRFFGRADGVEIDPGYHRISQTLRASIPRWPGQFHRADALTFPDYADYDVVYLYRPFRDVRRQALLERVVAGGLRPGAIVIGPLCRFHLRAAAFGLVRVGPEMFMRWPSRREVRAWLKAAQDLDLAAELEREASRHRRERRLGEFRHGASRGGEVSVPREDGGEWTLPRWKFLQLLDRLAKRQPAQAEALRLGLGARMPAAAAARLLQWSHARFARELEAGRRWLLRQPG